MKNKKFVMVLLGLTIVLTILSTACSASAIWGS
jgi:hypothetical protein